ncbi:MAG: PAS domain S-box protein, partial [Deltaproteobacteria bacterium]|nr:PAS domain S-box protein [Deltaproteobacteria bacterium]
MNEAASAIRSASASEQFLQAAAEQARNLIGAQQAAGVMFLDGEPYWAVSPASNAEAVGEVDWRRAEQSLLAAPILIRLTQPEIETHPLWQSLKQLYASPVEPRGWLAVLLVDGAGHGIGLLHLVNRLIGEFTEEDAELLRQVAHLTAAAGEHLRLVAQAEQSAAAHSQSEFLRALLFERNPQPMWVYDLTTLAFLAVNEAACQQYGYSRAEFEALTIKDIRPPAEARRLMANVTEIHGAFTHSGEWQHLRKDGTLIEVSIISHAITYASRAARLVVAVNITDQKRAQEALKEVNDRLNDILTSMTDAFFALDHEWRFTYLNPTAERLLRYEAAELLGHSLWEKYPDAVGSVFETSYRRAVEQRQPQEFEHYYVPHQIWFEFHAYPMQDGLAVYFRDITERKRSEELLHENELRLRLSLDAAKMGAWEWDLVSGGAWEDRRAQELVGASLGSYEEFIARMHPDDRQSVIERQQQAIRAQTGFDFEVRLRSAAGDYHWVESSAQPRFDAEGQLTRYVGVVRSIHERKQTEEALRQSEGQLRQAQKMEAIGRLAGGIAHDFNNLLTAINGYSDLMLKKLDPRDPLYEYSSDIRKAGERAANLTAQLLAF